MDFFRRILRSFETPENTGRRPSRAPRSRGRRWTFEPLEQRALLAADANSSIGIFGYSEESAQFVSLEFNGTDYIDHSLSQPLAQWSEPGDWSAPIQGDFDGDGRHDIVARELTSGQWWAIRFDGTSYHSSIIAVWNPASDYVDLQLGDFTGDGIVDFAARDVYGDWWAVRFNGQSFGNQYLGNWNRQAEWQHVMAADLDGNATADLIGQNAATGQWIATRRVANQFSTQTIASWNPDTAYLDVRAVWLQQAAGQSIVARDDVSGQWFAIQYQDGAFSSTVLGAWDPAGDWQGVAVLDADGDGVEEIIGRNRLDGSWWIVRGGANAQVRKIADWDAANQFSDFVTGDFNGDGREEVAARDVYGDWWSLVYQNGGFRNRHLAYLGQASSWQTIGVADVDGDQRDDILLRDAQSGALQALRYNGPGYGLAMIGAWSESGLPLSTILADTNGDGADELVSWNSLEGAWRAISRTVAGYEDRLIAQWRAHTFTAERMQLADVDGDGTSEFVEFDVQTAAWWRSDPVGGQTNARLQAAWNSSAAWSTILIGDVDGNGSDDLLGRDAVSGDWWAVRWVHGKYESQRIAGWNPQQPFYDIGLLDLNGDGAVDLVGREEDGSWWATLYDGQRFYNQYVGWSNPALPLDHLVAADLDADGQQELLVHNVATGNWWTVCLAATAEGMHYVGRWQPGQLYVDVQLARIAQAGQQLIGRDSATGEWMLLGFDEDYYSRSLMQWDATVDWRYARAGDLNGDGLDEIVGQDAATGTWYAVDFAGGEATLTPIGQWATGEEYSDLMLADVDDDGRAEIVGRSTLTGDVLLLEQGSDAYQTRLVTNVGPIESGRLFIGKLPGQSDVTLRRLIVSQSPGLADALVADRFEAARLILDWSANAANQALDTSLQASTDARMQAMSAAQVYYQLFAPLDGAVVCGGIATFYDRVLKLFGFGSFVIDFGDTTDGLTHMTVIVPMETANGTRFYLFDPTFNGTWVDAASGRYLALDEVLGAFDLGQFDQVAWSSSPLDRRKWLATSAVADRRYELQQVVNSTYVYQMPGYSLHMYLADLTGPMGAAGYSPGLAGFVELLQSRIFSVRESTRPELRDQFVALLAARGIPLGAS